MYQQLILIGNLGSEPDLRYTQAGVSVTSFSLAVNKLWKDASGQQQQRTIWFRVSAWRHLAELASQYLHKGSRVFVAGELDPPQAYLDRDGQPQASFQVTAHVIRFLDRKPEETSAAEAAPEAESSTAAEDIPF
jgi:single-strand DNA-binding protein